MGARIFSYPSVIWAGDNQDDPQFTSPVPDHVQPEELQHNPWLPGACPFVLPADLDPWVAEYLDWSDENAMKPAREPPGCQSELHRWDGIAFPSEHREFETMHKESHPSDSPALIRPLGYHDLSDEQLLSSQLAAERALFMTPFHPPSFPTFSASPASDPCGSPDMTPSSRWDVEHGRGDLPSSQTSPAHSQILDTGYLTSTTDEDDSMTTLEMPDGSTRLSSNWLPVDPTAGFTIGPNSSRMHPGRWPLDVEGFHDMREAFFHSS
ncbi:uncharacterized protein N7459_005533 [Penicillium hispanicum]|uniref:uncharacterized protein n=1 Tax=Penicillium hispanicum TaxID=1080232 RepID=UPI00253FCE78|nr:uncharacterized protein N7459_005533 [Penicillium hispanicum]KAJ5579548.1 hypothetical protein N7459_005533 [Penicillium hispanicum]